MIKYVTILVMFLCIFVIKKSKKQKSYQIEPWLKIYQMGFCFLICDLIAEQQCLHFDEQITIFI